jgi:hypothetical protein
MVRLAGLSRGRFEKIDEHGRAQQRLFPDDDVRFARRTNSSWAANVDGFSVEAGVHFGALDRKGRERLVRYCLRPPIAMDRFSILRDGSIALGAVDLTLLSGGRARLSFALHRQARTRRRHPEPARDRQDTRPSSATAAARRAFASGRSLLHRPAGARRLSELERAR